MRPAAAAAAMAGSFWSSSAGSGSSGSMPGRQRRARPELRALRPAPGIRRSRDSGGRSAATAVVVGMIRIVSYIDALASIVARGAAM